MEWNRAKNTRNDELEVKLFDDVPVLFGGNIIISQTGAGLYGQQHVVLTKMRNLLSLNISNFMGKLEKINRRKLICFDKFKSKHYKEYTANGGRTLDCVIAHFENVELLRSIETNDIIGYSFDYENVHYRVFFFGRLDKKSNDENGKMFVCGLNDYNEYSNLDKGWVRTVIGNRSFILERLIGIIGCVYTNLVPETFNNLMVNVMDCSGNVYTCEKFGTIPDFRPENLEWCLNTANRKHGNMVYSIFKRTGHLYRFSAYNKTLEEYNDLSTKEDIIAYCDKNFIKIR